MTAKIADLDSRLKELQADRLLRVYARLIDIRDKSRDPNAVAHATAALADLEAFGQAYERESK